MKDFFMSKKFYVSLCAGVLSGSGGYMWINNLSNSPNLSANERLAVLDTTYGLLIIGTLLFVYGLFSKKSKKDQSQKDQPQNELENMVGPFKKGRFERKAN